MHIWGEPLQCIVNGFSEWGLCWSTVAMAKINTTPYELL